MEKTMTKGRCVSSLYLAALLLPIRVCIFALFVSICLFFALGDEKPNQDVFILGNAVFFDKIRRINAAPSIPVSIS